VVSYHVVASRRYTVLIANRSTGVVRRVTLSVRPVLIALAVILALPILIGMGARWSARAEMNELRAAAATLEMENNSYREATRELTSQIGSLQAAIDDLGARSKLDAESARALAQLPAVIKARATGGAETATIRSSLAAVSSPEDTFGALRDLLGNLQSQLQVVRGHVERREALAAATPSIWPTYGWLSATFGERRDPFDGSDEFHTGLDISTEKGRAVFATAAGTVESAGWGGAYGNLVVIRHGFGMVTRYAHLSRFAVRAGDQVQRGEVIGYVGATGRATGAHLHYELLVNGQLTNPLKLLVDHHR
jgi:murein DD-endopeptidase MepM/ murein hydrolase activator NlpD